MWHEKPCIRPVLHKIPDRPCPKGELTSCLHSSHQQVQWLRPALQVYGEGGAPLFNQVER